MSFCRRVLVIGTAFVLLAGPLARAESNSVSIREEGDYRYIQSNGIPDHTPGRFPNAGNPNTLSAQSHHFRVPLNPEVAGRETEYGHDFLFGVALNGVPFDPGTAEYWNDDHGSGWNYEALSGEIDLGLDQSNAHVQPNGMYHYHGIPLKFLKGGSQELVGYAADGFPIYHDAGVKSSYRLKRGTRPSGSGGPYDGTFVQDYEYVSGSGDLDRCNGRTEDTPEYAEVYCYHLTRDFPYVPRCFKGEPDRSFKKESPHGGGGRPAGRGPASQGPRPGGGGMPPREAIAACSGGREGGSCSFHAPHGVVTGTCRQIHGVTACVP